MSGLEDAFGARLFQRTTRKVTLTETGAKALERARLIVEEFETLGAEVRGLEREPVGMLRVSSSIAFARSELVPHVPDFLRQYPHLLLDLNTDDRQIDLVAEGVDLAFRFGALKDSSLTARRLGEYCRVLVASPAYIERAGEIRAPLDLQTARCIVFTASSQVHHWTLMKGGVRKEVEIEGDVRASTGRVVLDFARLGLGVAMLPKFLAAGSIERGELVHVLPDWKGPTIDLHAVWASGRRLPRRARAFLEFIQPRLGFTA